MRRTKIVCTIGPATGSPKTIERLVRAGMDVARLNFSHGTHDEHARCIADLRAASERAGRALAILQDLSGPKIRVGAVRDEPIQLENDQRFTLTARDVPGDAREVSVTYAALPDDVRTGDTLLLSDGALEMVVESVAGRDIVCRVVIGGPLSSHKGINLPTRSIAAPSLTDKDRLDLTFGVEHGVDLMALSFVRRAEDLHEARASIRRAGAEIPLIAKIEKHEALDHLDAIVAAADGLMVARGDLGVEIPIERVPQVQKHLIARANEAGKPVITATQMLRSMVDAPRPTRAEATDVANAVLDGSDAVMLSEETAIGRYPVRTVETMSRIVRACEAEFPFRRWTAKFTADEPMDPPEAVAHAACQLAEEIGAAAIVTATQSGSTTRLVAKYRPAQPIVAVTPDEAVHRRLALVWGAWPVRIEPFDDVAQLERRAASAAVESGLVQPGRTIVLTAGLPLHEAGTTNLIRVIELPT